MNLFTATGKFFCHCGAETHAVMDGYQQGLNPRSQIVNCWKCGHVVGLAPATRVWSASTPQGARRKRLHELHHVVVHWAKHDESQTSA
jgi:hypothetical protein